MIDFLIRLAFVLLAIVMGWLLLVPARDVVELSRRDDPDCESDSLPWVWTMLVVISGAMWAGVYLAIKGI